MRYLITGAAGFIGSHLTLKLLSGGHEVIALDLSFSDEFRQDLAHFSSVSLVSGSVLDQSLLSKLVDTSDYVIHLAAIASPAYYVKEPKRTIDINLNASIAIIELLRFSRKPLFYTSTSEVFGKNPNVPWSEDDDRVLGPTNINRWCYSTSKAMIEHYMYACYQEGSLDFSGVRIFNCYGPRLQGRVVDSFIDSVISQKQIVVHGDGSQTRCFTYIDDLIRAIYFLVTKEKPVNKFYNIGSDVETSMNNLAEMVCLISGQDPSSSIVYVPHSEAIGASYEDIPRRVPCYSAALADLGWKPEVCLKNGLQQMYDYTLLRRSGVKSRPQKFNEIDE